MNYYKNINHTIDYHHIRTENPSVADFHLHERFEIYFFISGNVNYFIEKKIYTLKKGSLLIMNSNEIHKPSFSPGAPYERITIHFEPDMARHLSSPTFDLLNCFNNRPTGEQNLISLSCVQYDEIMHLFERLEAIDNSTSDGSDILKLTAFIDLLVYINRAFLSSSCSVAAPGYALSHAIPDKLAPVLDYIDSHLDGDLSLEALEKHFYINRFYMTRLFKRITSSSLHEYIIYKRLSKAKMLLSEGYSVTEACQGSGFNDYSNFLRTFKRTVGVSPGQFGKG